METVLSVENLSKTFTVRQKPPGFMPSVRALFKAQKKEVRAVDSISFSVERGEMLAFIGPNGAGKSTTIKLVTGILYPTTGSIRVLGLDPHKQRKALARRIGTVFGQRSQLWYHLPPLDTMLLLADIYDLDRTKAKARIDKLVELFGIKEYLKTPVRKLSLGERVRCEIAASLLHSPEVLFLDEPTIGLDVVVRQVVRDLIRRMNEEERTTVFLTSHDTGDIEKICRRAIVINHGRIVWDGTIKDMKYRLLRRKVIDLKLDAPLQARGRRRGGAQEPPVLRQARGRPLQGVARPGGVADHARQQGRGHHHHEPSNGRDHHDDLSGRGGAERTGVSAERRRRRCGRPAVKKYARIAAFAARDALAYLPAFLARNVFFVVIIFVFWSLWKVIFASRPAVAGLTLVQTLWYLTFTEAMELSRPRVAGMIQEEVRDGTLAVTLTRPWSYPAFHFWRSFGEGAVRVVPVLVVGFGLAHVFVGPLPGYLRALPFGLAAHPARPGRGHPVDARDRTSRVLARGGVAGVLDRPEGDLHPRRALPAHRLLPAGARRGGALAALLLLRLLARHHHGQLPLDARSSRASRVPWCGSPSSPARWPCCSPRDAGACTRREDEMSTHRRGAGLRLLGHYLEFNLAAGMEYRASFVTQVLGMILNNASFIVFWIILLGQLGDIRGYGFKEVMFLWALSATGYGLPGVFLGNAGGISRAIMLGELDIYLLQPKPVLPSLLASRMSISAWGDIIYGLVLFAVTQPLAPVPIALFLLFSVLFCLVLTSVRVLYHSLTFFLGNAEDFAGTASEMVLAFCPVPRAASSRGRPCWCCTPWCPRRSRRGYPSSCSSRSRGDGWASSSGPTHW